MPTIDSVLEQLKTGEAVAAKAVDLAERVAGLAGRGGPRWHRWRCMRLRIRAVNLETRRPTKSKTLRTKAAIHLTQAMADAGREISEMDATQLMELVRGREPLSARDL